MTEVEFIESLQERDLDGIDSEFSFSTRELIRKYDADGAHLNRWWVMTPVTWKCPSCCRTKDQIVRLNKNKYLTCQLHEHHDHMKDVVKELFESFSIKQEVIVADALSEKFAIKTAFSLSAYDNTVVCFDCNKADADAKKIVQAHRYFSFSPKQIGEFVIVTPNEDHRIDPIKAMQVWKEAESIFTIRMQMAEKFARIAAEKKDWYQPSLETATNIVRKARWHFERHGVTKINKYEPEKVLYTPEPFKGKNSSWREKNNPQIWQKPNSKQLEHLASTRGKFWNRYQANWVCPCCNRNKLTCVRPSKKNAWVLEIKSGPMFDVVSSEVNYQAEPMCIDCLNTALNLGREAMKETGINIDFPSSVICIEVLKQIILIRPHSQHNYLNEKINSVIPMLMQRVKTIAAIEEVQRENSRKRLEEFNLNRKAAV
ncbi:hypothetical protein PVK64_20380 [Aliivibrio sp. S4TY2]|uniref:hypothetical protein n=1 Tax=unclassified Aliivibrio TaxID=2645654 RepID=UPI0023797CA8|nr:MULTISPECIES: hypothetical protein [unclassified Aliivibrio]MDD9158521.1 hypothetical protein [Aliivibrio sp. S4TY2]MDD9162519.1 hypothetical protein [Aliivibrio sp. S4TY1]MDD9166518.1 hypothetical protein [Aliivibrio sp. S4MY2]MDD9170516.1 hypothetical protein [Aliivibrio sp. S4MY4]MDD9187597.1 hypothetical protein [Aliivibrio sp. S4MY3]